MTTCPQSDAAANSPNSNEELYKLAARLERENCKLKEELEINTQEIDSYGVEGHNDKDVPPRGRRKAMNTPQSPPELSSSALVRKVLKTCAEAGVEKVVAADHYGMIFLLSNGPEQIGGIVYRDDALKYHEMKTLASEVNAALLPNV